MMAKFEKWIDAYKDGTHPDPRYVMLWTNTTIMEDLAWIMTPNMKDIGGLQASSTILLEIIEKDNDLHFSMTVND